jgi:D-beta-D-heptose 7-phosphate kinase/D-beta-D-heptose 1-phosphate adenosyltransferase
VNVKNMTKNALNSILESLPEAKILNIGDIMLDRFVYGNVDRISPESPVPVLSIAREETMLGGAGNALANLAGLGCTAHIISVIGDDAQGQDLIRVVEKLGQSTKNLIIDPSRPTSVKTRYLAGHQQLLRADFEKKHALSAETEKTALEAAKAALKDVQAVILSDYGKGMLTQGLIKGVIEAANAANIPVIVDPKGQDYSRYRGATAVTPNKKELSEATAGMAVDTDEDVIAAAEKIIKECGIESVIATRSAEGMSVIKNGQDPVHIKTKDIEVFDVSGAGDSVIATIAAGLAVGADIAAAAALANLAGSIVVTKVGTAPIRLEELKDAAAEQGSDTAAPLKDRSRRADILGWEDAAEQIKRWKARGLKVGFTNGCFDILHFGHVTYLNDARDHCDRLVMGLNSDSSISILKGPSRPVHDEQSRAAVLAALGSIDMVVMFGAEKEGDDNTAIKLLETLKPDIYFKGGDYSLDQIPEAPTVMNDGGEVKVMPVYDGHSTTNSIAKINKGPKEDEAA